MTYVMAWQVAEDEGMQSRVAEVAAFVGVALCADPTAVLRSLLHLHLKHEFLPARRVGMVHALRNARDQALAADRLARYCDPSSSARDDLDDDILIVIEWWISLCLEHGGSSRIAAVGTFLQKTEAGQGADWARNVTDPDRRGRGATWLFRAMQSIEDPARAIEPLIIQLKLKKTVAAKWRSMFLPKAVPTAAHHV